MSEVAMPRRAQMAALLWRALEDTPVPMQASRAHAPISRDAEMIDDCAGRRG